MIPKKLLDETEEQLYRLREEMSDKMEQQTWTEVNRLIDKIQAYRQRFYQRKRKEN